MQSPAAVAVVAPSAAVATKVVATPSAQALTATPVVKAAATKPVAIVTKPAAASSSTEATVVANPSQAADSEREPLSKRQQRKLKGGGEGDGVEKKQCEPKQLDPEAEARKAAEQAAKKEAAAKLRAEKKAEAEAIRKAKQAEIAAQKKKEQEERRAAEAAAEKLAYELGMGTAELKGDRGYMEDRCLVTRLPSGDLFSGVYDGHCGEKCAQFAKDELHALMYKSWQKGFTDGPSAHHAGSAPVGPGDLPAALRFAFHKVSEDFCATGSTDGTTAVVSVIVGDTLHIASVGDSRAVLCRSGVAVGITHDHKPEDDTELARITAVGGLVDFGGVIKPGGGNYLKCARSLGDREYKVGPRERHLICAEPDIFTLELTDDDEFVVMFSDGTIRGIRGRSGDRTWTRLQTSSHLLLSLCLGPCQAAGGVVGDDR
jgi:serine/threonine protein phosphatase PrpC